MSFLSVIVPVYNREGLIERCLDSIANQSEKPDELIVVDNNSSDSTYKVIEKWMDRYRNSGIILKLLKEEKKGACNARQKGLTNAIGEWVIFFDSDDEMTPDLIKKAKEAHLNNPAADIVCWKSSILLLDGNKKIPPFMPENPLEGHLIHTLFRPQGYMVRKDFLERAGGWEKNVKVWNDFELGLRLLLNNPKIEAIDEVLSLIYSQEESITGKDFSSKEGEWETTLDEMDRENERLNHPYQDKIKKILNYRRAILAAHYYREGNKKGASALMREALLNKSLKERLLLEISYFYTRKGLRGVWRLVRFAY